MATPAMGLSLPTPNGTQGIGVAAPGQSWGELYNANFSLLDTHTHAPGSGSPVPTSGLAINADLTFGGFNATNLRSTRFSAIALGSIGAGDLNCLLSSSGDLYFVDGSGNQVRLTASGGVAGTPGAISGLASPAAVTYTPASKLFTFTSSTPRVAGIAVGPLTIGDATVDNGKQVTLSAPAGLAANYAMTLPTALPASDGLMRLSTTGALSAFGTIASNVPTFPAGLTLNGGISLASGFTGIQTTGASTFLQLQGNLAAASAQSDVALTSTVTRTAGFLAQVQSAGVAKLNVDFQGLLTLGAQAAPIQPAGIWTAITPDAGLSASAGLGFWKDANGVVHLRGTIADVSAGVVGGIVTTNPLPVGFRPASDRYFSGAGPSAFTGSITTWAVHITPFGSITLPLSISNGQQIALDGISFVAEQ